MSSLWRVVKFGFQDIFRNLGLSTMTVFILVLMLLSVNTLWSMDVITSEAVRLVRDQVNVSFYLSAGATDKNVAEIKNYITSFPEVTKVDIVSREDVLTSFQNKHKLSPEVLDALKELGGNPFGPTVVIKTKEPGDYNKIINAVSVPEYEPLIDSKSFSGHEDALDKIQAITSRIERVGMGLAILFALISFLIIFNTVRVAIFTQRVEIGIKRLVGANNWFIRGPYIIESIVFTVVSVAITGVILYYALGWLDVYLSVVFPNAFTLTNYYTSNMLYLVGIQTTAVLLLTIVSSIMAMRRQLKI